jgi:hypothetical protein
MFPSIRLKLDTESIRPRYQFLVVQSTYGGDYTSESGNTSSGHSLSVDKRCRPVDCYLSGDGCVGRQDVSS